MFLQTRTADTAAAIESRCQAIDASLAAARPQLIQSSLFDRRVVRQALASATAVSRVRQHLRHYVDRMQALRCVGAADDPRLIAVWAVEG
jgi:hypothetical protein